MDAEDYSQSFNSKLMLSFLWPFSVFIGAIERFQGGDD